MYYIGEINTGVPRVLGGGTFDFWELGGGGWGCINPCYINEIQKQAEFKERENIEHKCVPDDI